MDRVRKALSLQQRVKMATQRSSPKLGRQMTKEEFERQKRLDTINLKPERSEPQFLVKQVAAGLTVTDERTNILSALKICNLASQGGIMLRSIIVRAVPLVLIEMLELNRTYKTVGYFEKRKIDPKMSEKVAGAAAAALTVIYPQLTESEKITYIEQDIVGKAMKLHYAVTDNTIKRQVHGLLRVLGVLKLLPYAGPSGAGGFAKQPYRKYQSMFGRDSTCPKSSNRGDDARIMFKTYNEENVRHTSETLKPDRCPHCNERDHWIDECPVRKRDLFAELQARNEVKYGTEEAKKRMMKIRNEKLAEKKRQKRKKQPTVQN